MGSGSVVARRSSKPLAPKPRAPKPRSSRPGSFDAIRARAARRKGGDAALLALLPKVASARTLAKLTDDRALAQMAQRIFCAGFVWRVVESKWPGFEAAFLGFAPKRLLFQPDEFWSDLAADARIIRNPQKIKAVRETQFVSDIARQHGFGRFLADWPADDQVGLLAMLDKRGAAQQRRSGQYFLRFAGKDTFVTSHDVVACLRDAGTDISEHPTSQRDLARIQGSSTPGRRNRVALHAPVPHLRHVDRREP
jgi:3-methyladenine DNA glycosylase Tag